MQVRKDSFAQGTIEYLVIIAVVVVISLIVVGLVITTTSAPSQQITTSSSKLGSATSGGISIVEAVVDSSGDALINLRNNSGDNFRISNISGLNDGVVVGNNVYSSSFVSSGGVSTFSLANLGSACVCGSGEKSKTCTFEVTLTSASGLVKTENVSTSVECVTDAQGVNAINPITFQPIWAKGPFGGTSIVSDVAYSIFVDSSSNVYVAGYTYTDINFSPTVALILNGDSINFFVVKYNSNGEALWVKHAVNQTGVTDTSDYARSVFVDSNSNVYVAGYFAYGDINFSPTVGLTHQGSIASIDFFVVKYDSNGVVQWAKGPFVGTGAQSDVAYSVFVDSLGNVYAAGFSRGDLNFSSTVGLKFYGSSPTFPNLFVVKYNSSGEALWVKGPITSTGTGYEYAQSVFVDSSNNVYVAGQFGSDVNFSPTVGLTFRGGLSDFFVVKYDSSGNAIWAKNPIQTGGMGIVSASSVFVDSSSNVYVGGEFVYVGGDFNFSPTVGLPIDGSGDFFLVKYGMR